MQANRRRKLNTAVGFTIALLAYALLLSACNNSSETAPPDGDFDAEHVEDGDVTDTDTGDGDIDSDSCPTGMAWDALRQQCRPITDGDLDHDADNGEDADTIDGDQDAEPDSFTVTKSFSHNMDPDDPLLLPGEIRVTAGESGVLASFVQYSIDGGDIILCAKEKAAVYCSIKTRQCNHLNVFATVGGCYYPNTVAESFSASYFPIWGHSVSDSVVVTININLLNTVVYPIDAYHIVGNTSFLVYEDSRQQLIILDRVTGKKDMIFSSNSQATNFHSISKNELIWVSSNRTGSINPTIIYLYNLHDQSKRQLEVSEKFRLCDSEISDQGAVWIEDCLALDDPTADGRLIYYDLQSETKSEIDPQPHPKDNPAIDGTKIVWTDFRNGSITSSSNYQNADIYLHDLSKNQTVPISTAPGNQFWPRISGRYVIYEDTRWNRTPHDIVLFDLCTLEMYADDAMCRN